MHSSKKRPKCDPVGFEPVVDTYGRVVAWRNLPGNKSRNPFNCKPIDKGGEVGQTVMGFVNPRLRDTYCASLLVNPHVNPARGNRLWGSGCARKYAYSLCNYPYMAADCPVKGIKVTPKKTPIVIQLPPGVVIAQPKRQFVAARAARASDARAVSGSKRPQKSPVAFPEYAAPAVPAMPKAKKMSMSFLMGESQDVPMNPPPKMSMGFLVDKPPTRKLLAVRAGEEILELPKSVPLRLLQPPPDIPVHLPAIVDPELKRPIVPVPSEPMDVAIKHLEQVVAEKKATAEPPKKKPKKHPERPLKMPPKDYQAKLCQYMKESGIRRVLLLHGTGMGKTYSIVYAIYCLLKAMVQTKAPGLERVKRIVFVTVEANFSAFEKARAQLAREYPGIPPGNITTITHGRLIADYADRQRSRDRYGGSIMVVDEAHQFSSSIFKPGPMATKNKAIIDATSYAEFVFLLTATPAKNKVSDFYIIHKILTMDSVSDRELVYYEDSVDPKWKVKKPSLLATYREAFRHEQTALTSWAGSEEYVGKLKKSKSRSTSEDADDDEYGEDVKERMWFDTGMFNFDSPFNLYCQISVVSGVNKPDPTRPALFEDDVILNFVEKDPQYVKEFKRIWFADKSAKQEGFRQAQRIVSLVARIKQPLTAERRAELNAAGAKIPKNQKYDPVRLTIYPDKTIFSAMLAVVLAACNKKVVIYADFVENGVTMFIDLMQRIMRKMEPADLDRMRRIVRARLAVIEPEMAEKGIKVRGEYANVLDGTLNDIGKIRVFSVVGGVDKADKEAQINGFNDEIAKVRDQEGLEHNVLRDPANPDMHKIMVVSGAGGVGAEFLGVNHMIMLSPPWSTGKYLQARGRVDRTRSHEALRPDQRYLVIYKAITNVEHGAQMLSMEDVIYKSLESKDGEITDFYKDMMDALSIEKSRCDRKETQTRYPGKKPALYWESGIDEEEEEEAGSAPL